MAKYLWAVQVALLGCTNVGGTPAVGLDPPHLVVASRTHTLGVVWTSMAIYFYGHPSTRTNGQRKWRGWDAQTLGGCPAVGLHPAHPVVASRTHTVGVVWTSMAIYFYGHARTRTNSQCKRRGWDAQTLGGCPAVGLHPAHPVVASRTHTVGVVWTSMARYFYGHSSTWTNGQCTRRGRDAKMLWGHPPSVFTLHTWCSHRGRTP